LVKPQDGTSVWSDIETAATQDDVLPALGKLAARVRRGLGESWLKTMKQDRPLPLVTTSSLPALRMYADGRDSWRRGEYNQAVQLWRSALQADPDFAMVHAAMGGALYSYVYNNPVEGKQHYERAVQLAARTTDRENLLIRSEFAHSQNHFLEALQLTQQYLQDYPDDAAMRGSLAHLLRSNGQCPEAIVEYKEVLRVDPRSAGSLVDIATCDANLGNLPEALKYYDQAFEVEPSWRVTGVLNHEYGMALARAGQEDKARALFKKILNDPNMHGRAMRSLAYLDLLHGQYHEAKTKLQEALLQDKVQKANLSIVREHCLLAMVYEGMGERVPQVRELDEALQLYPTLNDKVMSGVWMVRGYTRAGRTEQAAQVLETMKKQADANNTKQASLMNYSEAQIEAQRGTRAHALELLLLAERQDRSAWVMDGLGRLYEASGDAEQAAKWSKTFADTEAYGYEAQQDWLESHVRLAKLDLERGNKDEARATLDRFLALWKDADKDLQLFGEAQKLREQLAK